MRRREFLGALGGAASWPLAAHTQERERMRRIGVMMNQSADDDQSKERADAFLDGLRQRGWVSGQNIRVDLRWNAGTVDNARNVAAELVALSPDVILASGVTSLMALRAHRDIPQVFAVVPDPVGAGFVESLARPGGNVTGFMQFEYNLAGKWLELLREIAPGVKRALVLRDADISAGVGQFAVIQAVAPSLGVDVRPTSMHDAAEIERAVSAFAQLPNGGLIVTASPWGPVHRELIASVAIRHKVPSVNPYRPLVASGGLLSYGANFADLYRGAASYVDRILKGEKPADLPVQAPTKYELVINLKTAKALGITVPPSLLARADEVIE